MWQGSIQVSFCYRVVHGAGVLMHFVAVTSCMFVRQPAVCLVQQYADVPLEHLFLRDAFSDDADNDLGQPMV